MNALSEDGKTRVRAVQLDGSPLYYVERRGLAGWYFDGAYRTAEEVARVVDLATLVMS